MPDNVSFTHTQTTPASVWMITHNLNTMKPTVNVWFVIDGETTAVLPAEMKVINANTIKITFSSKQVGTAKINSSHQHVYTHVQTEPASVWHVVHNLNDSYPNFDTIIDFGNNKHVVLPQNVVADDTHTLTITFSSSRTGKVVVSV